VQIVAILLGSIDKKSSRRYHPRVMLRNIPNKVDQAMLKTIIDEPSFGKCDCNSKGLTHQWEQKKSLDSVPPNRLLKQLQVCKLSSVQNVVIDESSAGYTFINFTGVWRLGLCTSPSKILSPKA
jgi:hypothetical protein